LAEFRRILHIEDSETDAYVVKRAFRTSPDVEITWAATGTEGLQKVLEDNFDIVLLDYALPDMTGLEVLLRILEKRPNTPVVIVSGFGSEYVAARALHLGAIGYVNKDDPHFREELPQTLGRLHRQAEGRRKAKDVEDLIRQRPSVRHHMEDVLGTLKTALTDARGTFIASQDGLPLATSRSGDAKDVDPLSAMVCGSVVRNLDMLGGSLELDNPEGGMLRYKQGTILYRKVPDVGSLVVVFDREGDWQQDAREMEVAARDIETLVREA
jgi:CheY-like chemotaxis protein